MADELNKHEHPAGSKIVAAFAWVESAASVTMAIKILAGLCALLLVLDLILHRHSYAPGEGLFGFYCAIGFVAFFLIVLGAKKLRSFILRDETFYAPHAVDSEEYPAAGLELKTDSSLQADANKPEPRS